jgi:hypothetical protein
VRSPLAAGVCVTVTSNVVPVAITWGTPLANANENSAALAPPMAPDAIVRLPARVLVSVVVAWTAAPLRPGKNSTFGAWLKAGVSSEARFCGSHPPLAKKSVELLPVSIGLPWPLPGRRS